MHNQNLNDNIYERNQLIMNIRLRLHPLTLLEVYLLYSIASNPKLEIPWSTMEQEMIAVTHFQKELIRVLTANNLLLFQVLKLTNSVIQMIPTSFMGFVSSRCSNGIKLGYNHPISYDLEQNQRQQKTKRTIKKDSCDFIIQNCNESTENQTFINEPSEDLYTRMT